MSRAYYGLRLYKDNIHEMASDVCGVLGGDRDVEEILIETAIAETYAGYTVDKTLFAGMGLTQFDKIGFDDVIARTRNSDINKIFYAWGVNIKNVAWVELRYNPKLCMIFTRLKYKLIPEKIPTSVKARAFYWKKYYNSELGKGTEQHYIDAVLKYKRNI